MSVGDKNKNMSSKQSKKVKRHINARFLWLISLLAAVVFIVTFWLTPLFPLKWTLIVIVALAVVLFITFFLSLKTSPQNVFTKIINILVSIVLLLSSILIPYEVDKVSALFSQNFSQKVTINIYRMSDDYATANGFTNVYSYSSQENSVVDNLLYLKNAKFITSMNTDTENSDYALSQMNSTFGSTPKVIDRGSFVEAASALYNHEGDFMIMPSSYESILKDTNMYTNFSNDTKIVYSFVREIKTVKTVQGDTTLTKEPFSIFFGGNDEEGELSLEGRTDVCMVVTVNPNTHQVSIINLARDSYIPNPYYDDEKDKLTHLGLKGIDNTLTGLSNYLDETINNYVIINFSTFQNIITAINGVDIVNPYAFEADDGGTLHLEGNSALMYVRERHHLTDGDFGRNMHQQIVMSAIIDKITSAEGIVNFNKILNSISGQFLTNISSNALYGLVNKQLNENMSWNIVKYHVLGDVGMAECASVTGQELSVVYPYTNQVEFVKTVINAVDNGDYVEQQTLPDGSYDTQ